MTDHEKLSVLIEEVGEVAREILTMQGRRHARDAAGTVEALRAELVQVAAVCVAWIEALDTGASGDSHAVPDTTPRGAS